MSEIGRDMQSVADAGPRERLNRERVLRAAVELADEGGIAALSMRKLGQRLGVEAMSLYKHVANKEDLLDGVVDLVVAEMEIPAIGEDWREAMRSRAASVRAVLGRHPWAIALVDSRMQPGQATLRHHDAVIGCLLAAGFTIDMVAHSFALLDAFIYGFVQQETNLPFDGPEEVPAVAEHVMQQFPSDRFPHMARLVDEHVLRPGYDFGAEFDWGLDLILEGLEQRRRTAGRGRARSPR